MKVQHKWRCKHKRVIGSIVRQETSDGLPSNRVKCSRDEGSRLKINIAGTFIRKNKKLSWKQLKENWVRQSWLRNSN